ncbi:MAG: metallophosphoesterase, partial [Bacteroidales bacterium]|nr:metallophosphoesterase [Bacteroidales bacterium]
MRLKRNIPLTFYKLIIASVLFVVTTSFCSNVINSRKDDEINRFEQAAALKQGDVFYGENQIPDKEGMTIKGIVHCLGEGIPDVVVSDGYEVTTTDADGIYYLPSKKDNNYVFISVPGNYEVPDIYNLPQFFKRLSGESTVEQIDFSLIQTKNSQHVVITMADMHLADRNDDLLQYRTNFLPDVNTSIEHYKSLGIKVYGLSLGDMSWDSYWYSNNFALPEYLTEMHKINCTVFNVMGNHDNDIQKSGDFLTADAYRKTIGPNYYSFNLGKVHYVVLDNIVYNNTGGSSGKNGIGNYKQAITSDQMIWIKKDLAFIKDKNLPLIIAMHAPLYDNPKSDANGQIKTVFSLANAEELIAALEGFSNVHVLSGHAHINYNIESSESIMEHNTAAVCATWWWTG